MPNMSRRAVSAVRLVAAVRQALTGELVPRGLEQAARFTWAKCAAGHDAVYRELTA